jgi:hypothetical protein
VRFTPRNQRIPDYGTNTFGAGSGLGSPSAFAAASSRSLHTGHSGARLIALRLACFFAVFVTLFLPRFMLVSPSASGYELLVMVVT